MASRVGVGVSGRVVRMMACGAMRGGEWKEERLSQMEAWRSMTEKMRKRS